MATEVLKKQKKCYFTYIWRGIVIMAIGIYAGIMILKNGIGNPPKEDRGPAVMIYNWLSGLMEQGGQAEKLVPICFAGFFFILALIGLYNVIKGARYMNPARTLLGKSVLQQAKNGENFEQIIDSINTDMEQEPKKFGSIYIGRKWILGEETMRLADICGIFKWNDGMEDYVLCCVDQNKNIWACGLRYQDDRDNAAAYLQNMLPEVTTGNYEACKAFIPDGTLENEQTLRQRDA